MIEQILEKINQSEYSFDYPDELNITARFFLNNLEYVQSDIVPCINNEISNNYFIDDIKRLIISNNPKIGKLDCEACLTYNDLNQLIFKIYKTEYEIFNEPSKDSFFFAWTCIFLLFKQYRYERKILSDNRDELFSLCKLETDKYGLIKFKESMKFIYKSNKRYIINSEKDRSWLNIEHIPEKLLIYLEKLKNEKIIKDLSFKIYDISQRQIEKGNYYGTELCYNLDKLPRVSEFRNYEGDILIIKVGKHDKSITFEEIYPYSERNVFYSQVVHLCYFEEKGTYFIEHIDHEYILYDKISYEQKINDLSIKGKKGKYKTFKIDNSKIPFFHKNQKSEFFLYVVLCSFFKNRALINEYFEKIRL